MDYGKLHSTMIGKLFNRAPTQVGYQLDLEGERQLLHANGLIKIPWADAVGFSQVLLKLRDQPLLGGYSWEQKYRHTSDLRPQAYTYDSALMDILFANNIPAKLEAATGQKLWLGHIQVRRVEPSRRSYMDWHRDTYYYGGNLVGNLPPVHKIIYYPRLGTEAVPALSVCPGSHRRLYYDQTEDHAQVNRYPVIAMSTDDTTAVLFETSLLHAVAPHRGGLDAMRVIYSFCEEWQLERLGNPELHQAYRKREVS